MQKMICFTQGLAQQALVQSGPQDFFEQHPLEGSVEQHFLAQQGLLQSGGQPPPQAHELRARADRATTDMNDNFWIRFFISLLVCFLFGYSQWISKKSITTQVKSVPKPVLFNLNHRNCNQANLENASQGNGHTARGWLLTAPLCMQTVDCLILKPSVECTRRVPLGLWLPVRGW